MPRHESIIYQKKDMILNRNINKCILKKLIVGYVRNMFINSKTQHNEQIIKQLTDILMLQLNPVDLHYLFSEKITHALNYVTQSKALTNKILSFVLEHCHFCNGLFIRRDLIRTTGVNKHYLHSKYSSEWKQSKTYQMCEHCFYQSYFEETIDDNKHCFVCTKRHSLHLLIITPDQFNVCLNCLKYSMPDEWKYLINNRAQTIDSSDIDIDML